MQSVKDILLAADASIIDAMKNIERSSAQIALVIDPSQRLLGTVTDGDIRRAILRGRKLEDPISTVMNTDPLTFPPREVTASVA